LLDSFGPRGRKEICTEGIRSIHPARDRAADAHAALAWLAARPDVRRDSIHVLGWSNGGITVLQALASRKREAPPGLAFRSAVAFYPNCLGLVDTFTSRVPLLIQAGGADDWTPARTCEAMVAAARERGVPIEIDVYEGAHHAFDGVDGHVRFRPEVRNISSPTGRGAHVGRDPVAQEKSWIRVTEFIENQR
jgi:dienelactone hydrolase